MYVRNKVDAIETGKIPTFEEACKQRDALLQKQGRYFIDKMPYEELTEEELQLTNEPPPELEALKAKFRQEMQAIVDQVNEEWKK